ncbi:MAG: hypothetical protein HY264_02300 [Chloroflexi bacterium]|nr:hypothetical protein [Chloroflexota bacterium]
MTPALGARYARVVAAAGAVALVTIGLFLGGFGAVFGPLNDAALLVMTLALAPVMATFYKLGGRTPLRPAQASLVGGIGAALTWCVVQALMILGIVAFDYGGPARGAFAVEAVAVAAIGLWIAGADVLAGPWLPQGVRWLGIIAGIGVVAFAAGLLRGGVDDPLTTAGGIGYQVLLPAWAFLLARTWGRRG